MRRVFCFACAALAFAAAAVAGDKIPVVVEQRAPEWSFTLEPYAWCPGVYGSVGVGQFPAMSIDTSPIDVLRNLDWGFFARGEIRRARWGLLLDGFYARFSAGVTPPGPLYSSANAVLQQSIDSALVALRVWEREAFALDAYAGARLYYMALSVSAEAENSRFNQIAGARFDRELPTSAGGQRTWVDPVLGVRGTARFTRQLFATVQADAGGFGAGSDIAFFTQAALGVNITRHVSAELGYRYMFVDYQDSGFLFRANMPGVYAGMGVTF